MSKDRFEENVIALHLFNDCLQPIRGEAGYDKLYKGRKLLDMLNKNFKANAGMEEVVSIDKQMIPYKGTLLLQVFMKNKPSKWGIKIWALAAQSSYVHSFIIFGDNLNITASELGIGEVMNFMRYDSQNHMPEFVANKGHTCKMQGCRSDLCCDERNAVCSCVSRRARNALNSFTLGSTIRMANSQVRNVFCVFFVTGEICEVRTLCYGNYLSEIYLCDTVFSDIYLTSRYSTSVTFELLIQYIEKS
jgi:hypothetical protein